MKLHLVYRSTGKENRKARPPFYSKKLALFSFLRAAENLPQRAEIIFLNDAPIPESIESIMVSFGEVINIVGLTLVRSYRTAIGLPKARHWNDGDLVYFSEDDYLYAPDAFVSLIAAARQMPRPSYFGLYAARDGRDPNGDLIPPGAVRVVERQGKSIAAAGHEWKPAMGTTSTFGVQLRALRKDFWLHHFAPLNGGAWDHVISIAYKGHHPFHWKEIIEPFRRSDAHWAWAAKLAGLRAMLNLGALTRLRWHPLMAPTRCLATHMESKYMAAGVDWKAVADETQQWAAQKGLAGPKANT